MQYLLTHSVPYALFTRGPDRHMVDSFALAHMHNTVLLLPQRTCTHIIYEHMFSSCWSLAITLTTWSRYIAVPTMTWYKQCSLFTTKIYKILIYANHFIQLKLGGNLHSWQIHTSFCCSCCFAGISCFLWFLDFHCVS